MQLIFLLQFLLLKWFGIFQFMEQNMRIYLYFIWFFSNFDFFYKKRAIFEYIFQKQGLSIAIVVMDLVVYPRVAICKGSLICIWCRKDTCSVSTAMPEMWNAFICTYGCQKNRIIFGSNFWQKSFCRSATGSTNFVSTTFKWSELRLQRCSMVAISEKKYCMAWHLIGIKCSHKIII